MLGCALVINPSSLNDFRQEMGQTKKLKIHLKYDVPKGFSHFRLFLSLSCMFKCFFLNSLVLVHFSILEKQVKT